MSELYPDLRIEPPVRIYTGETSCKPPDLPGNPVWMTRVRLPNDEQLTRGPILLIHGLSANRFTFLPQHRGVPALAPWLARQGYDVWIEEWRGTGQWDQQRQMCDLKVPRSSFTLDAVAEHDHPAALSHIIQKRHADNLKESKIDVIAHCVGAATFAMSVARGHATQCGKVVLSALGLFYTVAPHRLILAQDHILDAITRPLQPQACGPLDGRDWMHPQPPRGKSPNGIDYYDYWSERQLASLYALWRDFHIDGIQLSPRCGLEYCKRVSFMYGEPYLHRHHEKLQDHLGDIHTAEALPMYFGPAQIQLFHHAVHCTRSGVIRPHPALIQGEHTDILEETPEWDYLGAASRARFTDLDRLTLLTGHQNHLWSRDSIDRMYEWLLNAPPKGPDNHRTRFHKKVLASFAHQDLYWGHDAPQNAISEVYEAVLKPALS
ncbi:MAG: hypothetical protein ACE366_23090 [Bradymonadia bacterium]